MYLHLGNSVSGIFNPASGALLPFIVKEQSLQQANAYFSIKNALLTVFGIVLAGVLYAAIPVHYLFLLVGVCYLLSGISEMFIRYQHIKKDEKMSLKLALSDMHGGIVYLKGQKAIMVIILAALFINFFMTPVEGNFLPFFIKTDLSSAPAYLFDSFLKPELWYSVFGMLAGLSSLIGSIILSARPQEEKVGRKTAIRICYTAVIMILATISYWLLVERGLSMDIFLILFCLGSIGFGFCLVFINIPLNTALMRVVDKDKLSKVTSIISIISQGLTPIASVISGAVLQYLGSTILLTISSAGIALTAIFLLLNKHTKEI